MKIQNNNLLSSASKNIEFYNTCVIAKEGPNMVSKMGLGDLEINYDSVLVTRQTLASQTRDMPIMYGFLGTDITFLLIKPNYGGMNPQNCSGSTQYLEYYYEDEPLVRRTFTDILVLSGDADHRIPQVYLYNPNSNIVTVDIMAANLDENTISTSLVPTYSELRGLSFSSIQTDQIFGVGCTGSTQFEIYDINDNLQMVIPYNKIDIITIQNELLTVSTKSDDDIKLTFLSSFNALQALSRMNWVMEMSINRYATAIYPGLDTTAPIITFNVPSPQIISYTDGVVSQADIRWRYINSVVDYDDGGIARDGTINNADVSLLIYNNSTGEQVTAITHDARYSVTFTAKDLAGNYTNATKDVIVDANPPTIYYTTGYSINIMDLTGHTQTPGTIYKDDLRRYYLNYVWDNVDGVIANSAVTITITSGTTLETITGIGYYTIGFSVSDTATNTTTGTTNLRVTESVAPVINYNNVFIMSAFTMSISADTASTTGITETDIRNYAISGVTDNYDGIIAVDNVIVSGATFPIDGADNFTITFSVSDSAGNTTTNSKWLTATN
jgi:hypothetical protein